MLPRLLAALPERFVALILPLSLGFAACAADDAGASATLLGPSTPPGSDAQVAVDAGPALPSREDVALCGDQADNDRDGLFDCQDPDCISAPGCGRDGGTSTLDSSTACNTAHGDGVVTKTPVDVVWVIDDSLSMLDDITRVQQNMAAFASSLIMAGLDYHIIVLNEPALTLGAAWDANQLHVDPTRFFPLSVIAWNDCYTPAVDSFAQWSSHLRPDASLHFIMVTDDNSFMSWTDFQTRMSGLLSGRHFTVHAIVDPPQHCLTSSQPGSVYWEGAMATGGQQRSICEADWTPTFAAIQDSIRATAVIPCQYAIPEPTGGATYDRSKVNVQYVANGTTTRFMRKPSMDGCGSDQGWYYDNPQNPTQVLLCPAACTFAEKQGGSINVEFVCNETMLF
jgi:hypothetical protein